VSGMDAPSETSKQAIVRVATRMFARHGYAATSLRQIAREVGVDAALIIRHFGSKEALFLESIVFDEGYETLFDGPLDSLGRRIVIGLVGGEGADMYEYYAALVRCSDLMSVQERLRDTAGRGFLEPLAARLDGPDADLRARLILAQVNGLLHHLAVVVDPTLRALSPERLADAYAPALQALIDGRP
jgi:AcrR family transcriptional regulator